MRVSAAYVKQRGSYSPAHPVQITSQPSERRVAAVREFHFEQVRQFGFLLEIDRHVVVENTNAALGFDSPHCAKLRRQFAWIKWLLRGQALFFAGQGVLAHLAKMAFEQVAVNQRVAVVKGK